METPATTPRPAVEIGCVIAGVMHPIDFTAARQALQAVVQLLEARLPEFAWHMKLVHRREAILDTPVEPMRLLDLGVQERAAGHWDFALVLTEAELRSLDRPFMLGAPSQVADVALLSTARLDPAFILQDADDRQRRSVLQRRVTALVMHLFGHLNDLPHSDERSDFMYDLSREQDLDAMEDLSDEAWERLRERLHEVADPRVEERTNASRLPFVLRVLWQNRAELLRGMRRIAPWQFPFRYGRLTTAAVSTQVVLAVTAEAWELGMSQHGWKVIVLSALALFGASYYVILRQHLVSRFGTQRSEQTVTSGATVITAVILGMLITYSMLFGTTWVAAKLLFPPALVHNWTPSIARLGEGHYLSLAGFIASLGIVIGALGASFEQESYFRRIAMLDEET